MPTVLYKNRHCDQDGFSILICEGENENKECLNDVYEQKWPMLELIKFPSMLEQRIECKTVVVNSDIFAVGGYMNSPRKYLFSIEVFSAKNKTWCHETKIPDKREAFSICSLKQSLYVIGGWGVDCNKTLSSCLVYNTKSDKWSQTADLNDERE